MLIGILETGRLPAELQTSYGSYPDMFRHLLGTADKTLTFRTYSVLDDQFPASAQECDAWLVTGSRHGVYDNLPWMHTLQDFIRTVRDARVPMLGICFGHQIIAAALGGRVEKSTKGWGVGLQEYTVDKSLPWLGGVKSFTINAMHQDQVVERPPEAEVFASSAFCEYAGLLYGDSIMTFQGHPEFSSEFEQALLKMRRGAVIPEPVADQALAVLESGKQPETQTGQWMVSFLTKA